MKWRDLIELGLRNLVSRKSRSLLTIGGVAVGIMAVIFLVSIGYGIQDLAIRETVQSKSLNFFDIRVGTGGDIRRLDSQVLTKLRGLNDVQTIYPQLETPVKMHLPGSDTQVDLVALVNDRTFVEQTDLQVSEGRLFADTATEALVSTAALEQIGLKNGALGSTIAIRPLIKEDYLLGEQSSQADITFTVVGLINDEENPYISLPIEPIRQAVGEFAFSAAKIEVAERSSVQVVRQAVSDLGLETEYLGDVVEQLESIFHIARLVLGGLGLVATFVAALGMFNTLSVSLMERTREIGIMKTLGIRKRDVWKLFLIEGMLISILGGLVGIALGVGVGKGLNLIINIIARATDNPAVNFYSVPVSFILMILALILLLGAAVGLLPARRATKISPLEALRYE